MRITDNVSLGNVLSILVSLATLGGLLIAGGVAWGAMDQRMKKLEVGYDQAALDSRTLIEVRTDVIYIKKAIERMERATSLASSPTMCPSEKPVLVATHCRTLPMLD